MTDKKTKRKSRPGRFGGRASKDRERYAFWIDSESKEFMQKVANESPEKFDLADIIRRACREFVEREKAKQTNG